MQQLRRGKADCTITWRRPQAAGGALEIDAQALERVLAAVHAVMRALREPGAAVSGLEVLRWPGVLREDGGTGEQLLAASGEVFAATLTALVAAGERAGDRKSTRLNSSHHSSSYAVLCVKKNSKD